MPEPLAPRRPPIREVSICALLAVLIVTAFWGVWQFEYVYFDDPGYVLENVYVQRGLTKENIKWAFTTTDQSNWHPLAWISHMVDIELFGFDSPNHPRSGGPHVVNILLHTLNAMLLFLVLRWMTGAVWQSAVVAALFAVHPMHVESVVWVAERKDVLSTCLGFITLAAYVWYTKSPDLGRSVLRYVLVFALFFVGLLAKPMLVTLPCLFLLLDYWPLKRFPSFQPAPRPVTTERPAGMSRSGARRTAGVVGPSAVAAGLERMIGLVLEKVPLMVLSVFSSYQTWVAQNIGGSVASLDQLPMPVRIENALHAYMGYIGSMFCPRNMAVLYLPETARQDAMRDLTMLSLHRFGNSWLLPLGRILVSPATLLIVVISVLVLLAAYFGRRYLLVGWLWYLGVLVPVIGIVQVGEQSMADRYSYVSYVGLFIMIAWGLGDLLRRWLAEWPVGLLVGMFTGGMFGLLLCRVVAGAGVAPLALWMLGTLAAWSLGALVGLALAVLWSGFWEEGGWPTPKQCLTALVAGGLSLVLAVCVFLTHQQIQFWRNSDAILHRTLTVCPNNWSILNNLGVLNWERSEKAKTPEEGEELRKTAMKYWNTAVSIRPGASDAQSNLGYALAREAHKVPGQVDQALLAQAIQHLQAAIQFKEILPEAHNNLGLIHKELGHTADAIREFQRAIELRPSQLDARDNLAQVYMERAAAMVKQGDPQAEHWYDMAEEQVQAILPLNPFHLGALQRLTQLRLKRGDINDAIAAWENVLKNDRDPAHPNQLSTGQLTAHEHLAAIAWKQGNLGVAKAHLLPVLREMRPPSMVGRRLANYVADGNAAQGVAALRLVAWLLATSPDDAVRNGPEAILLAEDATRLTARGDAGVLDTLAAAYAASGHFPEAARVAQEASALAQQQGKGDAAKIIRARGELYRQGRPFREAS